MLLVSLVGGCDVINMCEFLCLFIARFVCFICRYKDFIILLVSAKFIFRRWVDDGILVGLLLLLWVYLEQILIYKYINICTRHYHMNVPNNIQYIIYKKNLMRLSLLWIGPIMSTVNRGHRKIWIGIGMKERNERDTRYRKGERTNRCFMHLQSRLIKGGGKPEAWTGGGVDHGIWPWQRGGAPWGMIRNGRAEPLENRPWLDHWLCPRPIRHQV